VADEERPETPEFWRDEEQEDRADMCRQAVRWGLIFAALLASAIFVLWWATSAIRFSASRADTTTAATWRVWGTVRDARTGAPVAWAQIGDDPAGRPPLFGATAALDGSYELTTIAEPHEVVATALGYRAKRVKIGRGWYLWMPIGSEQADIALEPESSAP
jgi:hypothetical protein